MIIRRRHTADFTTIGNALFEDQRLAADEVGINAYLLSRPHNWEVRRPALMRRWRIGREAMKRIITNLIRTGWWRAEKTRLGNGTFYIVYEIRDECGPTLTDDQVRAALSLVSSEAAAAERSACDLSPIGESAGQAQADLLETGGPPTGQPSPVDQGVVTRSWSIEEEDLLKTELPNTESQEIYGSRAREGLISKEAQQVADDCVRALGFEAEHPPIELAGLPYQTSIMLARGYDAPRIIAAFARFAGQRPVKPLTYFVKVVETACTAQPLAPPSTEKPDGRDETVRNGFVGRLEGDLRSIKERRNEQVWDNVAEWIRERFAVPSEDGTGPCDEASAPDAGRLPKPQRA
jgi:hypothetical protein